MSSTEPACTTRDCFVHRVQSLPLVNATVTQLSSTYTRAKTLSPAANALFSSLESSAAATIDATHPFYEKYLFGMVCLASKVACRTLDVVEAKVPAIRTTPDELREMRDAAYERSVAKRGVDAVRLRRDAARGQLLAVLDYCDSLVDHYVADDLPNSSQDHSYARTSIATRVVRIPRRVYLGVDFKLRRGVHECSVLITACVDSLRARLTQARKRVGDTATTVKNYPGQLALRAIRQSTRVLAFVSDSVMRATETVSSVTLRPLAVTNAYLKELDTKASKSTLGQMASESQAKITDAGRTLIGALNGALLPDADKKMNADKKTNAKKKPE